MRTTNPLRLGILLLATALAIAVSASGAYASCSGGADNAVVRSVDDAEANSVLGGQDPDGELQSLIDMFAGLLKMGVSTAQDYIVAMLGCPELGPYAAVAELLVGVLSAEIYGPLQNDFMLAFQTFNDSAALAAYNRFPYIFNAPPVYVYGDSCFHGGSGAACYGDWDCDSGVCDSYMAYNRADWNSPGTCLDVWYFD